jgi:hypothetical protein
MVGKKYSGVQNPKSVGLFDTRLRGAGTTGLKRGTARASSGTSTVGSRTYKLKSRAGGYS